LPLDERFFSLKGKGLGILQGDLCHFPVALSLVSDSLDDCTEVIGKISRRSAVAYKGTKKRTQWHVSCYEVNGFPNPHRFSAPIQFNHSPSSYKGNILHLESPFPGREYRRKRASILLGGDRHNEKQ
jgi:hypothetical protein